MYGIIKEYSAIINKMILLFINMQIDEIDFLTELLELILCAIILISILVNSINNNYQLLIKYNIDKNNYPKRRWRVSISKCSNKYKKIF